MEYQIEFSWWCRPKHSFVDGFLRHHTTAYHASDVLVEIERVLRQFDDAHLVSIQQLTAHMQGDELKP